MSADTETAFEAFYKGVKEGHLPAAVPVVDVALGVTGLGAVTLPMTPEASTLVLSPDPEDRAVAAIFALFEAEKGLEQHYETIRANTQL